MSLLFSPFLFGLLPLNMLEKNNGWSASVPNVPPPPLLLQQKSEKLSKKKAALPAPELTRTNIALDTTPMSISLDVTPGDFKAAFSLASYNPAPNGLGQELVFSLHELDRNPSVIKRGNLMYPSNLKDGDLKVKETTNRLMNRKKSVLKWFHPLS